MGKSKAYIGSSDAPPIVGVPSYGRTELDVWEEKLGLVAPRPPSATMRWGTLLEPLIIAEYARTNEVTVDRRRRRFFHPDHPMLGATVDGSTARRIVEAKFAPFEDYGDPLDGEAALPPYVRVQVQHQLMVTGKDVADVVVLVRGWDLRTYEVPARREYGSDLREELVEWWDRYVVTGQAPPPPADPIEVGEYTRRIHPRDDGSSLVATDDQRPILFEYATVRAQEAVAKRRRAELEGLLQGAMGVASGLTGHGARITWRAHDESRVGWREVAKAYRSAIEAIDRGLAPETIGALLDVLEGPDLVAATQALATEGGLDAIESLYTVTKPVRPFLAKFEGDLAVIAPQVQEAP